MVSNRSQNPFASEKIIRKMNANISGTDFGTQRARKKIFSKRSIIYFQLKITVSFLSNSEYKCNYTIFIFFWTHEFGVCVMPASTVFTHLWLPMTRAKRERNKKRYTFGGEIKTHRFKYHSAVRARKWIQLQPTIVSLTRILILFCFVGAVNELVSFSILKSCDSFVCGEENRSGFMCMRLVYLLLWPGLMFRCVVVSSCIRSYSCDIFDSNPETLALAYTHCWIRLPHGHMGRRDIHSLCSWNWKSKFDEMLQSNNNNFTFSVSIWMDRLIGGRRDETKKKS